jgi:hypothetical protein
LDRSHASVIQSLSCKLGDKKVKCRVEARSDAEFEIWGARRKMEMFSKVLGQEMTIGLAK